MSSAAPLPASELIRAVSDIRACTLDLVSDLSDEELLGPRLAIVNPPLWEMGHVGWFQERWVLRHWSQQKPFLKNGDTLYDSAAVDHDVRWDLRLPGRQATLDYLEQIRERVTERLKDEPGPEGTYFVLLSVLHECMHAEAFTYTRQTHSYCYPPFREPSEPGPTDAPESILGDAHIPGGSFELGASRDLPFVFDNEKWAHQVEVKRFSMAKTPVTQGEFTAFVEDDGYRRRDLWSSKGWAWKEGAGAKHPVYWRNAGAGTWLRRHFDEWVSLEPHLPVTHVNWFEADAFCRWAGRRLPTEMEWEFAASQGSDRGKRKYPWGDEAPTPDRANLNWAARGCVTVDSLPAGDSAFGCRQMVGNIWEWTSTDFTAYPEFTPDPYKEYSQPWFHDHKVLRGGCWTTRSLLIRNTWRNFYQPHRRDVFGGFRTCAM